MATSQNMWTETHIQALAPDEASIPAAREVLRKGGFGTVEPTADGRGWWVVCHGLTNNYEVSVRRHGARFECACTCPSHKRPCKHALALLLHLVKHPELRVEAETPPVMASDFEALLRAVFHNPKDDTPRLVFADFLEENDQPDRAAFIRYGCEFARLRNNSKRRQELAQLLVPIWKKLQRTIEPLPGGFECVPVRGFLRVEASFGLMDDVGVLPARFTNLFRDGWVETVVIHHDRNITDMHDAIALIAQSGKVDVSDYLLSNDELLALVANTAQARATGRLARIEVNGQNEKRFNQLLRAEQGKRTALNARLPSHRSFRVTPPVFNFLVHSGQLNGANSLSLNCPNGELGDAEVTALLNVDLRELRSLSLSHWWKLTRAGLTALANSTVLSRLTRLSLLDCNLHTAGAETLATSTGLRELEILSLLGCGLTDADAETLAQSRSFPKLTQLDLCENGEITSRSASAILAAKNFPLLNQVNLRETQIAASEQIPLLLDAAERPNLIIVFANCAARRQMKSQEVVVELLNDDSVPLTLFRDLKKCAGAKQITQFSALGFNINAKDVTGLAAAFDSQRLKRLNLSNNPLQNAGAEAIASAFAKYQLQELNLAGCRIQAGGVEALVASPLWKHLEVLDLSRNNIAKAGVTALLGAEIPPKLKQLTLTDCWPGVNERKTPKSKTRSVTSGSKLKAKFGARAKC